MSADSPSLELASLQPLAPNPNGTLPVPTVNAANATPNVFTDAQVEDYKEQDRWLPIANVARIMKNSLPSSAKVSKEAKECVQECVSEYISFITSEAADKCTGEKRKTINGEDILGSMRSLGFDNYEAALKIYLAKHRAHQNMVAAQRSQAQTGTGASTPTAPGESSFLQDLNAQHKRDFAFSEEDEEFDDDDDDGKGKKRRRGD